MTAAAGKPLLWLPDTSSLLSLAVDDDLASAVQTELQHARCRVLDVVVDELEQLASGSPVAQLASKALGDLAWLGDPVDSSVADLARVREIQDIVRAGKPLKHDLEHWAESVTIEIAERMTVMTPHLLIEDYNARIEARNRHVAAVSIHKLLSQMVQGGRLAGGDAEAFARCLVAAGRSAWSYTADEFRRSDLGRVGRP